jgi:hypothetical protein
VRTVGSAFNMSQSPILGPMDKLSMPTGWYSTLSRSDCRMLLTEKEASGSRNYPMRSGGRVLNPLSQRDNRLTSWSTAPKQFSLPTSCGIRRQWINRTKAYLKIAGELISMDSKKLVVPPSSNQQGT